MYHGLYFVLFNLELKFYYSFIISDSNIVDSNKAENIQGEGVHEQEDGCTHMCIGRQQ